MDELFDDPVRRQGSNSKKVNDEDMFDFTKSKKGLGELYEDDYRKKLMSADPNAFLSTDISSADSAIKQEILQLQT